MNNDNKDQKQGSGQAQKGPENKDNQKDTSGGQK
jgi:hypothetical protein